jgi:ABC-type arginine transport system permease subunit
MKIIKVSLPIIAITILFSAYANQSLKQASLTSIDAGALPETTAILQKMKAKAFRQAANPVRHLRGGAAN